MPKTADYLYAFRGTFDREPHGVCWVRVFEEAGRTPVIVMGELPRITPTSVTNMAEYLAPGLIQCHITHFNQVHAFFSRLPVSPYFVRMCIWWHSPMIGWERGMLAPSAATRKELRRTSLMDAERFDTLTKTLSMPRTRRRLVGLLAVLPIAGGLVTVLDEEHAQGKPKADKKDKKPKKPKKDKGNGGTTCLGLGLGQPCSREQPWECCSGSCRPASAPPDIPYHLIRWPDGETPVCVDAAFGCTTAVNDCPPTGDTPLHFCPNMPGGHCMVSVEGLSFCGFVANPAVSCQSCESDRDCTPGHHCTECEVACHDRGTGNRGCFSEGAAAA